MFVFSIIDFCYFYQKHKVLDTLRKCIVTEIQALPETTDIIEKDYQKLLHVLYTYAVTTESQMNTSKTEMLDYYTLWTHQIKTPISALKLLLQANPNQQEHLLELLKIEKYVEMALQYLRLENISSDMVLKAI